MKTYLLTSVPLLLTCLGCSSEETEGSDAHAAWILASVVIDADGNRTTYVQTLESLDDGPFDNTRALEIPGNGVVLAGAGHFYVGLAERPEWVKYGLDEEGRLAQVGSPLSFLNLGVERIDYGNVLVDEHTAVSVLSGPAIAVVWDPSTMEIRGEIDLSHLIPEDPAYGLEVWTTSAHDGLVYIPGRWSDWENGRIRSGVSTTIVDPKSLSVVGVAEDDRCDSGGRVVFGADGYAYVMGDGRNYSNHMFANALGEKATDNCLLRIAPGETDFEEAFHHTIPSLTGGLQSITELETGRQGSGWGFSKMFYPEELPEGVEPVDFDFWGVPAHKMWRIELADPPSALEVESIPFSTIGFGGSMFQGRLYSGESPDGNTTDVYEIDPETNRARIRFSMDGYFNGLYELGSAAR